MATLSRPPGGLVKMRILVQQLWGGAWDSVFLTGCDVARFGTVLSTERTPHKDRTEPVLP